ncbi:unnamed protein product [Adineta steineri]|uniref:Uncharacterized protein n=1 Tax=Adineta steineri TaxID=433720 RepID=A0A814MQE3_9BILA|nr:unnamed protein product [Adineta steineri]CAF1658485.1 unnamed protein product [Adineta steineri]
MNELNEDDGLVPTGDCQPSDLPLATNIPVRLEQPIEINRHINEPLNTNKLQIPFYPEIQSQYETINYVSYDHGINFVRRNSSNYSIHDSQIQRSSFEAKDQNSINSFKNSIDGLFLLPITDNSEQSFHLPIIHIGKRPISTVSNNEIIQRTKRHRTSIS